MVGVNIKFNEIKKQLISQSLDIIELKQHQETLAKGYKLLDYQIDVISKKDIK